VSVHLRDKSHRFPSQVGVLIEEPFSILPLAAICKTSEKDVAELVIVHNERLKRRARKSLKGQKEDRESAFENGGWQAVGQQGTNGSSLLP
jgi:hypothetical protein